MRASFLSRFACPLCHGEYRWEAVRREGDRIIAADVHCPSCGTTSLVRDGIGYFHPGDAVPPPTADRPPEPIAPDWTEALEELRAHPGSGTADPAGSLLEVAFRGFDAPWTDGGVGGDRLVVGEEGVRWKHGDGGSDGGSEPYDALVAELHSLPLKVRSFDRGVVGPGLQLAPGRLVLLREMRRVVHGPLEAVALLPEGAPTGPDPGASHMAIDRLLDDFRRARWSPTLGAASRSHVEIGPQGGASRRARLGWVRAE